MKRKIFPICSQCGSEINPRKYHDCEKLYDVGGEAYCKDCFIEWLGDWMEHNLDDVAKLAGVPVVYLEQ